MYLTVKGTSSFKKCPAEIQSAWKVDQEEQNGYTRNEFHTMSTTQANLIVALNKSNSCATTLLFKLPLCMFF